MSSLFYTKKLHIHVLTIWFLGVNFQFYLISRCNHCGKLLPLFVKSDQIVVLFPEILNYNVGRNPKFVLDVIVKMFGFLVLPFNYYYSELQIWVNVPILYVSSACHSTKSTTKKQRQDNWKFRKGQDAMVTPLQL